MSFVGETSKVMCRHHMLPTVPVTSHCWFNPEHLAELGFVEFLSFILSLSTLLTRWLTGQESPARAGGRGSMPESGRSPGGRNSYPLQYSCLEHPMDTGAWWPTVHGVAESRKWLSTHSQFPLMERQVGTFLWGFLFFYFLLEFIVALPCYISFCCTGKWIDYSRTHRSPLLLDFLPIQVTTERGVDFPVLYSRISLVIYFIQSINNVWASQW